MGSTSASSRARPPGSSSSETTKADKLEQFVRELVKVGVAELRKEGVIAGELSGRQS
jgi:hypothetical protein